MLTKKDPWEREKANDKEVEQKKTLPYLSLGVKKRGIRLEDCYTISLTNTNTHTHIYTLNQTLSHSLPHHLRFLFSSYFYCFYI